MWERADTPSSSSLLSSGRGSGCYRRVLRRFPVLMLAILLGTGSKENTAVALAGEVISESGDLFGLHGVSMQVRKHKDTRRAF